MSDRDKDAEILALRHLIVVLERQLGTDRVKFTSKDRAFLAALLVPLPARLCADSDCLSNPTPCCDGTATSSSGATPAPADPRGQAARPPFARSAS